MEQVALCKNHIAFTIFVTSRKWFALCNVNAMKFFALHNIHSILPTLAIWLSVFVRKVCGKNNDRPSKNDKRNMCEKS